MPKDIIPSSIRFEAELLNKIAYVAKQNKRSLNAQLAFLAQQCVDEYEKVNGEIEIAPEQ